MKSPGAVGAACVDALTFRSMRELLEKAHQQDEDELFAEVEDDEEFVAPRESRPQVKASGLPKEPRLTVIRGTTRRISGRLCRHRR
jgi:hypothetical protein